MCVSYDASSTAPWVAEAVLTHTRGGAGLKDVGTVTGTQQERLRLHRHQPTDAIRLPVLPAKRCRGPAYVSAAYFSLGA